MDTLTIVGLFFYLVGFFCAFLALWRSRTPQGTVAWIIGLITVPFLAVPLFLVFGRKRFIGYIKKRQHYDREASREIKEIEKLLRDNDNNSPLPYLSSLLNEKQTLGFTGSNKVDLLINGHETYESMLQAIESAEKYILLQVYIFREDKIGTRFADLLMRKARDGIKVYFLTDRIGSELGSGFMKKLNDAGVHVHLFSSWKNWGGHFQINFRNHRKVLVVDGKTTFIGGHNIGDDYLGRWKSIGPWRDTHLRIEGPAALSSQLSFFKDWHWAKEEIIDLEWVPQPAEGEGKILILPPGPADEKENCLLAHLALVQAAKKRIWIATPYLVLPESLYYALSLAALNGIEVKILVPSYSDNRLIHFASQIYIERLLKSGVEFYRYLPGFLHQKVMLIDEQAALVGSVNLDSRSLFINFEIFAVSPEKNIIDGVSAMLENDFEQSEKVSLKEYEKSPLSRQILCRATNLIAPML